MTVQRVRNGLVAWTIGAMIIFVAVIFLGYRMMSSDCAPVTIELGVLVVIPAVYLALMFLTLREQE
ncbi:hypothetical protein [Martelella soudanensis]|uniref:hypothetical protein n=1 Tax=unclassified Martelella TaxID=2629616 RepID=UPI0015DDB49D|nr:MULTISPECIES: hypothetical protein [unclassified Martelella]